MTFIDTNPPSRLVGFYRRLRQRQRPITSARMNRRLLAPFKCLQHRSEVSIEGAEKLALEIVEVARFPNFSSLLAEAMKTVALDRIVNRDSALCAVNLHLMRPRIGVRGIVGANQAANRAIGELQRQRHRAETLAGHVGHLRLNRRDRTCKLLQHIKAVTLCFDQVRVGMPASPFAAEALGGKDNPTQSPGVNRRLRHLRRLGITMIEIYREK